AAPGGLGVPWEPPPLVAVHEELDPLADARPHRLERADVIAPVAAVKAQLHGREALLEIGLRGLSLGGRIAQRPRRGVRPHPVREPAEESPARGTENLAGKVPEREIERPAPPVVEVDAREHAIVALEGERILAHEELLVALEAEHTVAGAETHEPAVRRDAHDRGVETDARLRVPARVERGLERQAMMADGDRRDPVLGRPRQGAQ